MIRKIETGFSGLFILESPVFSDKRGMFKKTLNADDFCDLGLLYDFRELYYSINNQNVLRGMHFQTPPYDHIKMVYCVSGHITDVCIDIRKQSPTYGRFFSISLTEDDSKYVYIPKGFAHGFLAHENRTIVHYAQNSCYAKEHDCGLRYDSFGFDWSVMNPILSERDLLHPAFQSYVSPF